MKSILILFLSILLFSCEDEVKQLQETEQEVVDAELPPVKEPFFEVIVTEKGANDFGYQILQDGKMMINQQTIPAIPGNAGFSSRENALKAGEFTLSKIKSGSFPPTVSPAELDSLGVL